MALTKGRNKDISYFEGLQIFSSGLAVSMSLAVYYKFSEDIDTSNAIFPPFLPTTTTA